MKMAGLLRGLAQVTSIRPRPDKSSGLVVMIEMWRVLGSPHYPKAYQQMTVTIIDYKTAKGWLLPEERELLFNLAHELAEKQPFEWATNDHKPIHILNIGVEYAGSVACLRAGAPNATIYASDIDWSKCERHYETVGFGDSHELVKTWTTPLDLIFVDGDHGFAGVLLDAKFADFVVPGGYILFQDCYDHDERGVVHKLVPGVNQAVSEWFANEGVANSFVELPYVGSTRIFRRVRG